MKIENQQEIWNNIAQPWGIFKTNPVENVADFLRYKKGRILDLGCGSGRNFVKVNGEIYGVDFSEDMLKLAEKNAKKKRIKADLTRAEAWNLPFKGNFFDAAIFITVLHCIPDAKKREKSLKELFRVLKSKAECLIAVWNKEQEKFKDEKKDVIIPWKHDGKSYPRYYHLYDEKEFVNLLEKTGFDIIEINSLEVPEGNSRKNINVIVRKP